MKKNLNDLPLFELFLDFGIGDDWIDIHNDYYCEKVIPNCFKCYKNKKKVELSQVCNL